MTSTLPWEHLYPVFLALFARIAAFLQTAPLTGERQIPPKVRVGVAALVAIAVVGLHPAVSMESLFYVLPGEVLLGLVAGFTARVVIAGVETGGELLGLQMGLGFASTFDPTLGDTALPMRRLAVLLVDHGGPDEWCESAELTRRTLEIEPAHAAFARLWIEKSDVADRIQVIEGDARASLPGFADESVDACFIDADKDGYPFYLDQCMRILRPGGLVMVDNAFSFGRLLTPDADRSILAFNDAVAARRDLQAVIVPLGDGCWVGAKLAGAAAR